MMRKRIAKGIAASAAALALGAFPAGAGATGNTEQNGGAPKCEKGQITALGQTGDGIHLGKAFACGIFNVPPRSGP